MGFEVNGRDRTVRLSKGKAGALIKAITRTRTKRRASLKSYQQLVGKLRHVALILPGARGLFSPINKALQGDPPFIGLGKDSEVRAAFIDLKVLIRDMANRPTHVSELNPADDSYVGYCDACATGAGGVWFSGIEELDPSVRQASRPKLYLSKTPAGRSQTRTWSSRACCSITLPWKLSSRQEGCGTSESASFATTRRPSIGRDACRTGPKRPSVAVSYEAWQCDSATTSQGQPQ